MHLLELATPTLLRSIYTRQIIHTVVQIWRYSLEYEWKRHQVLVMQSISEDATDYRMNTSHWSLWDNLVKQGVLHRRFKAFQDCVCRNGPDLWQCCTMKTCQLIHHSCKYLAKHKIIILPHSQYSLDWDKQTFSCFPS